MKPRIRCNNINRKFVLFACFPSQARGLGINQLGIDLDWNVYVHVKPNNIVSVKSKVVSENVTTSFQRKQKTLR